MEESALAMSMASMLVIAMICTVIFKKLKMPAIIGYLATGIILANYWNAYDGTTTETIVSLLSDLGLVLLMFTIGMELNFEKLRRNGAFSVLIVLVQVPIVIVFGVVFGTILGWDFTLSITLGAILAGSSTAVVLVVQREKKVLPQEDIDALLLILVVEDVSQVIMMSMLTPMMSAVATSMSVLDIVILLAKIIVFMVVATYVGIRFVPRLLNWIGERMDKEILIISALAFCFVLSALAVQAGMSMAVGAFLMGVIVSQCKFCGDIGHSIDPMKDVFMAMFFISIGLEVNPQDLADNFLLMIGIFLLFLVARTVAIYLGYFLGNKDSRLGFVSATSLLTMGEFAFILSSMAYEAKIMSPGIHAAVIGAALISMVTQSFITGSAGKIYDKVSAKIPGPVARVLSRVTGARNKLYTKMAVMSSSNLLDTKKLMATAYFYAFAVFIIIAIFYFLGNNMADSLNEYFDFISSTNAKRIIDLTEFILLLIPLSIIVSRIKSLQRYVMDPEARARGLTFSTKHEDYLVRASNINLWIPTFFVDFIILLLQPHQSSLMEQFLIAILGMVIFAILGILKFRRSPVKAEEEPETKE